MVLQVPSIILITYRFIIPEFAMCVSRDEQGSCRKEEDGIE